MCTELNVKPTLDDAIGLAQILADEYRYSALFRDGEFAQEMLVHVARHALESCDLGDAFALRSQGKLLGVIILAVKPHRSFGCVVADLFIALKPNEPSVLDWATSVISAMDWQLNYTIVGKISAYHEDLLPCLAEQGIGIDALGLVSKTDDALMRLRAEYELPNHFNHLGLSHSVMEPSDLEAVLALRKRAFTLAPQYCWFGANPEHLEFQYQRLTSDLAGQHAWWVIRDGVEIIGSFGSSISVINPMWGPMGGLELIFDVDYLARGMSKIAYALTLSKLVDHGCTVFKGITAQAPVMHLGKIMGRELFDIHLRGPADFETSHFLSYLGGTAAFK